MPRNIRSVITEVIVWFFGHGLSHRKMLRITGVSQCDISNILCGVRNVSSLTHGLTGHWMKTITWKEDCGLLRIMNMLLSVSRIRVELTRQMRRRSFVCAVQLHLVVAGYHSRHQGKCHWLTPIHLRRTTMVHHHQNWHHQHCSHVIFADEYNQPLSLGSSCPLVATIHQPFNNMAKRLDTSIAVLWADPELISKYHTTSVDGSSLLPVCQLTRTEQKWSSAVTR